MFYKENLSSPSSVSPAATLRVLPNRSQFFMYESVSLSCEHQGNSSEWRVKRNTSTGINEDCPTSWGTRHETHCSTDVYPMETGVYWCESEAGECSSTINITVTGGSVILESPVLPVMEGDNVTLSCTYVTNSFSNITSYFYKDELFIGSSSTGNLTIHSVSKSDEGFYKCKISGGEQSPDSWLTVREHPESSQSTPAHILLPVVGLCLVSVSTFVLLLCLCRTQEGEISPTVVLYTDVTRTRKTNKKGQVLRGGSSSLSSVAVYTPVRKIYTPEPVLTYRACS
ncbi:low affinity immunoglobulin gamma Fc region receptor II isoform X2 [Lates calcarifer]|uniref:low affinity immunoglobulin gamma Fc region receptor II isoform X2 n=1 Tax=Lates calcarifer TaxID=8187 RepID=UPI0021D7BEAA|nr:low affinity immunoglobulin gamma Fc region receptor II isoform X2 [Lates calcarifer]